MRMRHVVGVLLVGSLALAGCGGDDDDAASTSTTVRAASSTTVGTSTGSGSTDQARCIEAATAMAQAATDIPLALSGTTAGLRDSVDKFKAFADSGPSEIRDDLKTVAAGYDDFVKVLADANLSANSGQPPSSDAAAKIKTAADKLAAPDIQAAAGRVNAWFAANCAP